MRDTIYRDEAIKAIDELPNAYNGWSDAYDKAYIISTLEEVPSADRPRGEWILESGKIASFWVCSECDFPATVADEINDIKYFNYCPNCGADMKGADDE